MTDGREDPRVAQEAEVLAALTRILRREETESAIVTTRERAPVVCADGKVRYAEKVDMRVVELKPKLSDVYRAADLLGRRRGGASGAGARVVDDLCGEGGE